MRKEGFISAVEEKFALSSKVKLDTNPDINETGEYFVEHIRRTFVKKFGTNIFYKNGLRIFTTMNYKLQKEADEIIEQHVQSLNEDYPYKGPAGDKDSSIQAALIAMSVIDGASLPYREDLTQAPANLTGQFRLKGRPGSSFKPIVYTAAILSGMTPADMIVDSPVIMDGANQEEWKPENLSKHFMEQHLSEMH